MDVYVCGCQIPYIKYPGSSPEKNLTNGTYTHQQQQQSTKNRRFGKEYNNNLFTLRLCVFLLRLFLFIPDHTNPIHIAQALPCPPSSVFIVFCCIDLNFSITKSSKKNSRVFVIFFTNFVSQIFFWDYFGMKWAFYSLLLGAQRSFALCFPNYF